MRHYRIVSDSGGSKGEPTLDLRELASHVGDDMALFTEVRDLFLEDCAQRQGEMRTLLAEGRTQEMARAAHALKGAAANFGATRLVHAARQVEELSRADRLSELPAELAVLEDEAHRVIAALREIASLGA